jgi:hypothetical protein
MSTERCGAVQAALSEAFLGRDGARIPDDLESHLASCEACAAVRHELASLAADLRPLAASPEPSAALRRRTLRLARLELAANVEAGLDAPLSDRIEVAAGPRHAAGLPPGFARECLRLLGGAVAALPVIVGWNWLVLQAGGGLLASLLPEPVIGVLAGAYLASVAGGLAFLYGSIPFVAHRRALRSLAEVRT